jgi:hypothetical protein
VIANHNGPLVPQIDYPHHRPERRVGWQAVMAYISNVSPLAVFRPLKTEPYQDAMPRSNFRRLLATGDGFVDGAARFGVAFARSGLAVALALAPLHRRAPSGWIWFPTVRSLRRTKCHKQPELHWRLGVHVACFWSFEHLPILLAKSQYPLGFKRDAATIPAKSAHFAVRLT